MQTVDVRAHRQLLARILLLLALIALVLPACDIINPPVIPTPVPTASPVPPTPTQPAKRSGGTLTVRLAADPTNLNPWLAPGDPNSQKVAGLLFGGLTRLDDHLQPQPDLAENWDVSEDGTSITFHLRPGVLWHDGQPFTADDVVWSYRELFGLPAQTTALAHIQDTIQAVEPVDPVTSTVRFTLKRRFSPILADLAVPILPSHILTGTAPDKLAASPFNSQPVGTGPFQFDSRLAGQNVVLKVNSHYHAGEPQLDRVAFVVAPSDDIAASAVRDGTLMLAELASASAEKLVTQNKGIQGSFYTELGYDFVAFNLRPPHPFSDTRLRQAWSLALDKQGLVFQATGGTADPVWSDVNKISWAYNASIPHYDGQPDQARKLLADAGWADTNGDGIVEKNGKPLEVNLYVRSDNDPRSVEKRKVADAMVAPLARAGIRLVVQPADFQSAILARISPTARPPFDFDVVMLGWTRNSVDPDSFALFHSSQIPTEAEPQLLNFTGFAAPEYDSLAIQARSTYDVNQRKELYARMQQIIADQLPYYFLWSEKTAVVASPKLKGDIDLSSPNYLWNVSRWWIEP